MTTIEVDYIEWVENKICVCCSVSKDVSEFYRQDTSCRDCRKAKIKAYRLANVDKVRERERAYYEAHRLEDNARSRSYQHNNRERINEYRRLRFQSDPTARERRRAYLATWEAKNPERVRAARRKYARTIAYGLTEEQFDQMWQDQDGQCACCHREINPWGRSTHIDHDHACCAGPRSCGKCVRGIVCGSCNVGLGKFRDDPILLASAIEYLERWKARRDAG